jgi:hypothetical protein
MVLMDALPHYTKAQHTKFLPRLNIDQDKTGGIGPRSNLQALSTRSDKDMFWSAVINGLVAISVMAMMKFVGLKQKHYWQIRH